MGEANSSPDKCSGYFLVVSQLYSPHFVSRQSAGSVWVSCGVEAEVGPARVRTERSRQREDRGITEREGR